MKRPGSASRIRGVGSCRPAAAAILLAVAFLLGAIPSRSASTDDHQIAEPSQQVASATEEQSTTIRVLAPEPAAQPAPTTRAIQSQPVRLTAHEEPSPRQEPPDLDSVRAPARPPVKEQGGKKAWSGGKFTSQGSSFSTGRPANPNPRSEGPSFTSRGPSIERPANVPAVVGPDPTSPLVRPADPFRHSQPEPWTHVPPRTESPPDAAPTISQPSSPDLLGPDVVARTPQIPQAETQEALPVQQPFSDPSQAPSDMLVQPEPAPDGAGLVRGPRGDRAPLLPQSPWTQPEMPPNGEPGPAGLGASDQVAGEGPNASSGQPMAADRGEPANGRPMRVTIGPPIADEGASTSPEAVSPDSRSTADAQRDATLADQPQPRLQLTIDNPSDGPDLRLEVSPPNPLDQPANALRPEMVHRPTARTAPRSPEAPTDRPTPDARIRFEIAPPPAADIVRLPTPPETPPAETTPQSSRDEAVTLRSPAEPSHSRIASPSLADAERRAPNSERAGPDRSQLEFAKQSPRSTAPLKVEADSRGSLEVPEPAEPAQDAVVVSDGPPPNAPQPLPPASLERLPPTQPEAPMVSAPQPLAPPVDELVVSDRRDAAVREPPTPLRQLPMTAPPQAAAHTPPADSADPTGTAEASDTPSASPAHKAESTALADTASSGTAPQPSAAQAQPSGAKQGETHVSVSQHETPPQSGLASSAAQPLRVSLRYPPPKSSPSATAGQKPAAPAKRMVIIARLGEDSAQGVGQGAIPEEVPSSAGSADSPPLHLSIKGPPPGAKPSGKTSGNLKPPEQLLPMPLRTALRPAAACVQ